jgi:hypothetical protein
VEVPVELAKTIDCSLVFPTISSVATGFAIFTPIIPVAGLTFKREIEDVPTERFPNTSRVELGVLVPTPTFPMIVVVARVDVPVTDSVPPVEILVLMVVEADTTPTMRAEEIMMIANKLRYFFIIIYICV